VSTPRPGISLHARQRDFLASYPDEVVVDVHGSDETGAVHIWANGHLGFATQELWIPKEGFPGQPRVRLVEDDDADA
jgi:hypothetical protein